MANISLRAYNREISSLIDSGQTDEAIAHCQYILQTYPKYIETYRLLGKAYLEGQQHKEAIDVFQRVLTVAPDDFITHVGMSIIREDEGNLDAAIWHMERAFEVQPSNQAIQDELKHLYGKRDGIEPQKIRLTRGALCRMYARGNQYRQAVAEIKSLLAETPDRVDLEILLARMYYNLNMKVEATELCGRLLNKYPHCLEANRMMLKILTDSGKKAETEPYKQRIISLDPYENQVNDEYPSTEQVPEDLVAIEKLVYDPNQKPVQPETIPPVEEEVETAPDWMISDLTGGGGELGEKGFTRILDSTNLPTEGQPEDIISSSQIEPATETSATQKMKDVVPEENVEKPVLFTELPSTSTQPVEMEAIEDQLPDWLKDTEKSTEGTEEAIPDWLKASGWAAAGSITEDAAPTSVIHLESEEEIPDVPIVPAEIPDWVQGLAPAYEEKEPVQEKSTTPEGEIPEEVSLKLDDWLSGGDQGQVETISGGTASLHLPEEEGKIESGTPDWLKGLDEQGSSTSDHPVVFTLENTPPEQESSTPRITYPQPPQTDKLDMEDAFPSAGGTSILAPDDVPEWLQDLTAVPEKDTTASSEAVETAPTSPSLPVPDLEEPKQPTPRMDIPVQELVTTTLPPEDSLPDWLPEITKESTSKKTKTLPEEAATGSSDMPSWLSILDQDNLEEGTLKESSEPVENSNVDQNIEVVPSEAVSILDEKPTTSILPPNPEDQAEELPDWLKELDGYPEGTSPIADATQSVSDDFPDWLKSFSETESVEQAPITPASLEEPVEAEGEVPNWLSDLDLKGSTVESTSVDVPDWLKGLGPEPLSETVEETTMQEPAIPEAQPAEEIPDWIQSLQAAEPAAETETVSEIAQEAVEIPFEVNFEESGIADMVEPGAGLEVPEQQETPVSESPLVPEAEAISEIPASIEEPESLEQPTVEIPITEMELEPPVFDEVVPEVSEVKIETVESVGLVEPEPMAVEPVVAAIETPVEEEVIPSIVSEEILPEPEMALPAQEEEHIVTPPVEEFEPIIPEQKVTQFEEIVETKPEIVPVESPVVEEEAPEYDEIYKLALQSVDNGDLESAQEQFIHLIRAENHLDKVVEKLSSAVETYPTDSGLWMTLGDAFGRSGKLQNALDAYTKAEEYLQ